MARRKTQRKARALQPAVMKMYFILSDNATGYVSLSHSASRMNRRFYRQGLNWAVKNVSVTTLPAASPALGSVAYVNTIPHTWASANSWMKAYSAWKLQQDEAIDDSTSESAVAAFRDFKISMEDGHTVGADLSPVNMGPGRVVGPFPTHVQTSGPVNASEEWLSSEIVIPNDGAPGVTNEYALHMVGPDTGTSKGLIAGYQASRAYPQSPDPVSPTLGSADNWIRSMFDVGDDTSEVVNNAAFRNNELPYDQTDYPGGSTNLVQLETQGFNLNQSTIGRNTFNTGPFTAPCGLIRFDFNGQVPESTEMNIICVELVPGTQRGYLTETMEEF